MPSALMHLAAADELRRDGSMPDGLAAAVERAGWAYRLGSVLPDLPLFGGFWVKVALFLARRPYPESRWGAVVHARGAGSLLAALLEEALASPDPAEGLVLVAGAVTHVALDRAMHVPIEEAVRRHLRPSETAAQLHEAIENHQSLAWHRRHLGVDGVGHRPTVARIAVGPAGRRHLPPRVAEGLAAALERTYGARPAASEVAAWAAGLVAYRDLLGSALAALSVRSSERFGRERPWVLDLETEPPRDEGLATAREALAALWRAFDARDTTGLFEAVGDGPLV